MSEATLYYIADPMCSWCWGFRSQLEVLRAALPPSVELRYVMGGLAKDCNEPMEAEMREYIARNWRAVAARTGAEFNWDFWTECTPRRSTYPACRAVIAARRVDASAGEAMFDAIQRAYYLGARNPSDADTLVEIAGELTPAIDRERFARELQSAEVEALLQADFTDRRRLGVRSFPSLVLERGGERTVVLSGYGTAESVLAQLSPG